LQSSYSNQVLVPDYQDPKESLTAAFEFFNETSEQLTNSYQLLERRVQQLTDELDQVAAEKEQADENKQLVEGRMQALLNFLPGGVIVLDARGYILEANPAAKQLLDSGLEGMLWRDVIQQCFAPKNDDGLEVSTNAGKRVSIATSSLGNDGQIILLTDQTETRKVQETLSRNERLSAMGKMVSALAHQIRTPLSAALLYSGHLCNPEISSDKKDVFSKKVLGRLQHMEKQVRDMMLFVKSELPLNDIISLADLEIGLREASEVALMTSNVVCQWHNRYPNRQIKCHREALISALMNLINNGVQACDTAPKITITFDCFLRDEREYVRVSIVDDGVGIEETKLADAQQIFVTTKAQGTGLGISVVQSVTRAHGGSFSLRSVVNKGTDASIEIPIFENITPATQRKTACQS